jgi:hypothetical protein
MFIGWLFRKDSSRVGGYAVHAFKSIGIRGAPWFVERVGGKPAHPTDGLATSLIQQRWVGNA